MARPLKEGLDYFPLDVDFFIDDKLQFVSARFDEKGELIAIKLLCKIYKAGYFINWNEDAALLFSKGAGKNITPSLANEVVNELLKRGFFNQAIHKRFSVLTSSGIQKRYKKICVDSKRKDWKIEDHFDLLTYNTQLTQGEIELTQEETPQRKEKKIEREIKEKEIKSKSHSGEPVKKNELIFWKGFIEQWNEWYLAKTGESYNYQAKDFSHLKKIYQFLEKRAQAKKFEFTEENLLAAFKFFLNKAWEKDEWLRQNFSIPNILSQFNQIANGKSDSKNGKQPTGASVNTGSILSRINAMPD